MSWSAVVGEKMIFGVQLWGEKRSLECSLGWEKIFGVQLWGKKTQKRSSGCSCGWIKVFGLQFWMRKGLECCCGVRKGLWTAVWGEKRSWVLLWGEKRSLECSLGLKVFRVQRCCCYCFSFFIGKNYNTVIWSPAESSQTHNLEIMSLVIVH